LDEFLPGVRLWLESGNDPGDELRAKLRDILALCTHDEIEKHARDLVGIAPDWMRECFRQAATKRMN
jgi:hypothetical protein